jgi:hypothetical protein
MSSLKELVCPVSTEKVDERVTRLNALLVILLVIAGFLFNTVIFPLFLTADFFIRGFTRFKFSPLSYLSSQMANTLQLDKKIIDKAPKIFAARIGFIFSLAISVLLLFDLNTPALIMGGILVFFASLEMALAICMGCIMYTYLVLPFYK